MANLEGKIQIWSELAATFATDNPVLDRGQFAYEYDTKKLKCGDGSTAYNSLAYIGAVSGGQVDSVTGTTNRISVNNTDPANPVINISSAYDAAITALVNNAVSGKENLTNKDTDGTLAANSDTKYPSQKAVKTYADTKQSALGFTPENVNNKKNTVTNSTTDYPSCKAVYDELQKNKVLTIDTVQKSHTGTVTPTKVWSFEIPPNTFKTGDNVFLQYFAVNNAAANVNTRIKVNTSDTLTGALTIATYVTGITGVRVTRTFWFKNSTQITAFAMTNNFANDETSSFSAANVNNATFDTTVTNYIMLEVELTNSANTATVNNIKLILERA